MPNIGTRKIHEKDTTVCVLNYTSTCVRQQVKLDKQHWYQHVLKSADTSQEGKVPILWNQQVQTDRTTPNNKLNIIICHNEKGTCILTDVAILEDRNAIKKEAEETLKYKNLMLEIQHI
jgi:hypothetical protein